MKEDLKSPHEDGGHFSAIGSKKLDYWAKKYVEDASLTQNAKGEVDLFAAIGGWLGITKNFVPGTVFIVIFTVSSHLWASTGVAVATSLIFTALSLIRKEPLVTSLSGLFGVVLCAVIANRSGQGRDYYLPGFYMSAAALVFFTVLLIVRIPLIGVLYGYIRGEGIQWRQQPQRYRSYYKATIIVIMVFVLRLAVQVPLYLAGEAAVAFLGATRLLMGVPLYAAGLWLAWIASRPSTTTKQ